MQEQTTNHFFRAACMTVNSVLIVLVWIDTIIWKGLNVKSNMSVVCHTHTPQYELFGTEWLWKCLLPSAELHPCNNGWCSYNNSLLSWLNSSPIRWQFILCELITCYLQSHDPFRLCNTDNWLDWFPICTCHVKYSRQKWKMASKVCSSNDVHGHAGLPFCI